MLGATRSVGLSGSMLPLGAHRANGPTFRLLLPILSAEGVSSVNWLSPVHGLSAPHNLSVKEARRWTRNLETRSKVLPYS